MYETKPVGFDVITPQLVGLNAKLCTRAIRKMYAIKTVGPDVSHPLYAPSTFKPKLKQPLRFFFSLCIGSA